MHASLPTYLGGAFLTALVVSLVGTFVVRHWATARGYLDYPDSRRRIHAEPTPNVGGIAVALGATLVFFGWSAFILPEDFARREIVAMLVGGLLMFGVGFRDDVRALTPRVKFALQFVIATGVFVGGVRIAGATFLGWSGTFSLVASYLVTTVWIVGTTNAFNLIDGSDGVAAGAALFASASLALAFALQGDALGTLMAIVLVGSCLGFLFFNFPPASIFLGDSGSLFLGYTLAALGVITTNKASTILAVAIPVVAFGVPLLDTGITIIRRFLRREPLFAADRGHIHHRLRDLGHTPRGVALLIYVACAVSAAFSMLLATGTVAPVLPMFVVLATVLVLFVQRLDVPELVELRSIIGRGFKQRWVIAHNLRVQAAAEALDRAGDGAAILEALELAFEGSEFSRLEVWVPSDLGEGFGGLGNGRVQRDGAGHRLAIELATDLPVQEIEIRVPVLLGDERVGRFSIFRDASGERLFTDLRLLPTLLVPSLVQALQRVANDAAASRLAAEVARLKPEAAPLEEGRVGRGVA
jgi:UDP-GlcNAc:undecaprenyl-phosphate GlcNAc-1-phosphate transferase